MSISPTTEIISELAAGSMVILVDEADRENEGDLLIAAHHVSAEAINFMARYGRGLICLTLTEARCRQLNLPLMVSDNRSALGTAFTISIEAARGVTTGISAHDRARTIQAAVAADARPADLVQPGHIFPLMAQNGGVLVRAGHTEAGCDLAKLAGFEPAAVICEVLKDDGSMARLPDLIEFAHQHRLKIGTIADLIRYRSETERLVERVAEKNVRTPFGEFRLVAYFDAIANEVHLALVKGTLDREGETLVRVHEPLSVTDFLDESSDRHSFGVHRAMEIVSRAENGVIILLRRPETVQDVIARVLNDKPGSRPAAKWDPRIYGIGAQILRDLNVGKMRLLAHPTKMPSMIGFGLEVTGYVAPDEALTRRDCD
jgi:3,4-dihydroxy 2-butanone 4-phosphate synthase/GTP cyclohydrolase II